MFVTRFAPSPTGALHIGAARTAYFNWLFARIHNGKYLLRLEDTDKHRSAEVFERSILEGLRWLGLQPDEPPLRQSARAARHRRIAERLLGEGKAYKCYATPEELERLRAEQRRNKQTIRYDGRWRHHPPAAPEGVAPTIRFAAPPRGRTRIADLIQGEVAVNNKELDDMVLLRSDGTPTYMLAVAVDDHDMGVTHVIRGDDHLTNSFRQLQLFTALGWRPPTYAHMPLLHSADGGKLSKRHGATGVAEWRRRGFLPQAVLNYLLRLGWAHGDEEIIPTEKALKWFGIADVGRSPARLDEAKLLYLNGFYLRGLDNAELLKELLRYLRLLNDDLSPASGLSNVDETKLRKLLEVSKVRVKTLAELAAAVRFLFAVPDFKADGDVKRKMAAILPALGGGDWKAASIESRLRRTLERRRLTLRDVAVPLRLALTGSTVSPPLFAVMEALGEGESLARLSRAFS